MDGSTITFERQMPATWAILVAPVADRMRPGSGATTVPGTESFKPPNTEWATEDDLMRAGYVNSQRVVGRIASIKAAIERANDDEKLLVIYKQLNDYLEMLSRYASGKHHQDQDPDL